MITGPVAVIPLACGRLELGLWPCGRLETMVAGPVAVLSENGIGWGRGPKRLLYCITCSQITVLYIDSSDYSLSGVVWVFVVWRFVVRFVVVWSTAPSLRLLFCAVLDSRAPASARAKNDRRVQALKDESGRGEE